MTGYFNELRQFGLNWLTISFLITLFFTILQSYALFKQNQKIVKSQSGESVSFLFFSYFSFAGMAVIMYGFYEKSLALFINGFMGFIAMAISINLLRLEKISLLEKMLGLLSIIVVPLIIWWPERDILFVTVGSIINLALLMQIFEVWKNKSSGSIHPGPAIVSIFSNTFWLSYSIIADIWPMKIINTCGLTLWIIMLLTYYKYQPIKIVNHETN